MNTPYAWISKAGTVLVLGCLAILIGCANDPILSQQPRQFLQAYPSPPPPPPPADGSVWRDGAPLGMLFTDQKARTVGDLVTVNIVEVASASKEATTQTGRSSSVSAGVDAFFGLEKFIPPGANPAKVAGSVANNFDGSGKTVRSGKVTATVTAVVTQVLPNGNLVIEGSREITVNNEQELIVLSGVVRPKDISPGNVVLSTALGNGQIAYYGSGIIAEKQRPGWLGRVVDTVWPF
jgi:flagellar L-ring protein precursor FlgH